MNKTIFLIMTVFSIVLNAGYTAETDVTFSNKEIMMIQLSSNNLDLGEITPDMKEMVKINGISLNVKSNVNWILTIEPMDNLTSLSGDVIPVERFQFKCGKKEYTPLSLNNPVTIAQGEATDDKGADITVDFKLKIGWDDPAGRYSTKLRFTLNSIY